MSKNPTPSLLDAGQIVKRVFNDDTDALRVDANVTANISGAQEVIISDTDDSIKIGDGTGTFADVTVANALKVDGSAVTQPVSFAGGVSVNNAAGASAVNIQDGGNSITVDGPLTDTQLRATPVPISGTVTVTDGSGPLTVDGTVAATQSGTWNVGTVTTVTNVVHVDDNAGSLTVDNAGTFAVQAAQSGTWNVTNVSGTISLPTGASTAALQTQPGVDIGDVTINNASGGSAVNIQDGGNSITVDGTVAATQSGTWNSIAGTNSATGTGSADGAVLLSVDTLGYHTGYFQISYVSGDTGQAYVNFEKSNDNVSWETAVAVADNIGYSANPSNATYQELVFFANAFIGGFNWRVPFTTRYFRLKITGVTGTPQTGVISATLKYFTGTVVPAIQPVSAQIVDQFGNSRASFGPAVQAESLSVSIASDQTDVPVSAISLPLPTLAATSTKQSDGTQKTQIVDGSGSVIASTSNALNVSAVQSGTWNITNVSGTVSLPTGASTENTLAKLAQAQASTTSTQSGPLIQGAVTTSAPSYTTGQTDPLSLNTSGGLRVDGSGVTQPISAASLPLPTSASTDASITNVQGSTTGGTAGTKSGLIGGIFNQPIPFINPGNQVALQTDANANLLIANPNLNIHTELLQELILETRAMRLALVALVTEGMRNTPEDFDPHVQNYTNTLQ